MGEQKLLHVYSFLCFHPNSRSLKHNTGNGSGSDEGPADCAVLRDGPMIMMALSGGRVSFWEAQLILSLLSTASPLSCPLSMSYSIGSILGFRTRHGSLARLRPRRSDPAIWTSPLIVYPIRAWTSRSSAGETRYVVSCVNGDRVRWRARWG